MTGEPLTGTTEGNGAETAAAARLHDHIRQIVARVTTTAAQRAELADELYSGLWERWQSARAEGLSPDDAADRAMAAFGSPDQLGPELALAFHSRLYEATIGSLLPPAVASRVWPLGLSRAAFTLGLIGVFCALGGALAALTLSPTRAIVTGVASIAAACVWVLAARALLRGQRWALALGRLGLVFLALSLLPGIQGQGITINLVGLLAAVAAFPLLGPDLSRWVSSSAGIGLRRGLLVSAIGVLPLVFTMAPGVIPEVTAASASDVHLVVSMKCDGPSDAPTTISVTASVTWDRREPWPNGLRPAVPPTDRASAWLDATPAVGAVWAASQRDGHRYFQPAWSFATSPEADVSSSSPETAIWPGISEQMSIGRNLKSRFQWGVTTAGFGPVATMLNSVVVTYEHLGRFGLQAIATCASGGTGMPIEPPFGLPR